jgi:hypothetical protein
MGDSPRAEILISNLLENAIRYNIPGGRIQATTGQWRDQATITVSNTGPPVPADQVQRLLSPSSGSTGNAVTITRDSALASRSSPRSPTRTPPLCQSAPAPPAAWQSK